MSFLLDKTRKSLFPNWKKRLYKKYRILSLGKCRVVPKTLRCSSCSQNVSFLVKVEGASTKTNWKQAGTGPSRRHIQGSKIAKRLPSVKYSLLQYSKIENFSKKNGPSGALKSHSAEKKLKGGPFGIFQHPFCRKTAKKLKGGPFGEKSFPEKSLAVPKKIGRGDPLVSPGMVWYAGKQEKHFWFSSLDQIVQFGEIIFYRTFKNYFGQFVWIEKSHYNSRVSLHEAPTKKVA